MTLPETADQMIRQTIRDCLDGDLIETNKDNSRERLHYQTGMSNPRARIFTNPNRPLNIVTAIARFVWLASGNNRVEDIAYYEPKVRIFSDDGLTVPGSDYGHRLFQPRPNLDQIQGVIDRLRKDPLSRQAAAVVWQPEDAVRRSGDIPCTFGLFFHIRNDPGCSINHKHTSESCRKLHMCVNMRSNNAFRILPFNVFEFTMLQEYVAASVDVELGDYVLWAASMHVYNNEREWSPTVGVAMSDVSDSIVMDAMPSSRGWNNPKYQLEQLARLEARLRHAYTPQQITDTLEEAAKTLKPYWLTLFEPLAMWGLGVKREIGYDREWIKAIVPQERSLFDLAIPCVNVPIPERKNDGA